MGTVMHIPELDWDRVHNRVAEFNSSGAPYYLAEVTLHQAFSHGLTSRTVPLCVMAVNSFWTTNVEKEANALNDVCKRTVSALAEIKRQLKRVRSVSVPADPPGLSVIIAVARRLLPPFLRAPNGKRINYSFAAEFLHWTRPSLFPIVDKFSAKTINHCVGRGTIWIPNASTTSTTEQCMHSYENAIEFYNHRVLQQVPWPTR
jgi:hypothetical protein